MKWFWWIGGAVAYIVIKNEVGSDGPGMWILLFLILLGATLLGQGADAKAKKAAQDERDRMAAEAANEAIQDFRQGSAERPKTGPEK